MQLYLLNEIFFHALKEDITNGFDLTSDSIGLKGISEVLIYSKDCCITSSLFIINNIMLIINKFNFYVRFFVDDSSFIFPGYPFMYISCDLKDILIIERTFLNYLIRLISISTQTKRFLSLIEHTKCIILCTRKTTPSIRNLEKYAIKCVGGLNQRFNLSDKVLFKDNYMKFNLTSRELIRKLNTKNFVSEIEVKNVLFSDFFFKQELLLDNLDSVNLNINLNNIQEISGNIKLFNVRIYSELDILYLSTSNLVNNIPFIDLTLKVINYF